LGEKFIEMDNWKEERFTEVTSHIYHVLEVKEDALKKLKEVFQETKKSSSTATIKASTMTKENMVNSPFNTLGDFKKNTRGIGSKLMSRMIYDDQGIYKECQGMFIPIVA
jgi:hypothetical protein